MWFFSQCLAVLSYNRTSELLLLYFPALLRRQLRERLAGSAHAHPADPHGDGSGRVRDAPAAVRSRVHMAERRHPQGHPWEGRRRWERCEHATGAYPFTHSLTHSHSLTHIRAHTVATSSHTVRYCMSALRPSHIGCRTRFRQRQHWGRRCADWPDRWWPMETTTLRECPSAWSSRCPCSSEFSAPPLTLLYSEQTHFSWTVHTRANTVQFFTLWLVCMLCSLQVR